jgi:hypothetical protein
MNFQSCKPKFENPKFSNSLSPDLRDIVPAYTTLKRLNGPCPVCGGDDRFYIFPDWHACGCRKCDKTWDAIGLVAAVERITFGEAKKLVQGDGIVPRVQVRKPQSNPSVVQCSEPSWQTDAHKRIEKATGGLVDGCPGHKYLTNRGISLRTARAFSIGFLPNQFDPSSQAKRACIVVPWFISETVSGLKYRFIDELAKEKSSRFGQKGGSKPTIFGAHHLTGGGFRRTLIVVEGEFNAMAIWQATRRFEFDVVSFGSDRNRRGAEVIRELATRYERILFWADESERSLSLGANIPGSIKMISPGGKDANDLLVELGQNDFCRFLNMKLGDIGPESEVPSYWRARGVCRWDSDLRPLAWLQFQRDPATRARFRHLKAMRELEDAIIASWNEDWDYSPEIV